LNLQITHGGQFFSKKLWVDILVIKKNDIFITTLIEIGFCNVFIFIFLIYVTISLFIIVKKVANLFQISGERERLSEMKVLEASYKGG